MARKTTKTTETEVQNDSRLAEKHLRIIQDTVDDLTARIADDPARSLLTRLNRYPDVSEKRALAGLDAITEAVQECRDALAARGTPKVRGSRVNLADL